MKLTHSRGNFGNRWQRRNLCCRCTEVGVIRTLNLGPARGRDGGGRKVAIRWHEPEDWSVQIRGADEYEAAGI